MTIQEITIHKFRGFDHRSFRLDPQMNVVLGDNTTGKTTLLHAVQIALGAYLQELTLIPHGYGYSRNFSDNDILRRYSEVAKDFVLDPERPSVTVTADVHAHCYNIRTREFVPNIDHIRWLRDSNRNARSKAGELMDAVEQMERKRREADETGILSIMPLFLSFGSARMETNYNGAAKKRVRESRIEKAYKCALDEKVDFKSAFDWLYGYEAAIERQEEYPGTQEAFAMAITDAIPAIRQIQVSVKNCEFRAQIQMAKDSAPHWETYDMMSAGFQSMINVVAEIAYRCIMLNGFLGNDAVKKTPGVVMIDEIDLYLHPHWQQHVLLDLQRAFPQIQFIVASHSPFIIQSVDTHNILRLDGNGAVSEISPSNRGIEEIAVAEMGLDTAMADRSLKYRRKFELASQYYRLVKEGREGTREVKDELNRLETEAALLHDPAFLAALRLKRTDQ